MTFLTYILAFIACFELLIILFLLFKKRSTWVKNEIKVLSSKQKAQPNFEYRLKQADTWTKMYFNNHHHSKKEIGKMYERYIGYLKEQAGYVVEYHGIGFKNRDKGIDLICKKGDEIVLVQCKRLSHYKEIHENILYQLKGSLESFKSSNQGKIITAEVCTTAQISQDAFDEAKKLGIVVVEMPFDQTYPSIKCNINNKGIKHFFAPWHPSYDKITVDPRNGEMYCKTVYEASEKGFQPPLIPWWMVRWIKKLVGYKKNVLK